LQATGLFDSVVFSAVHVVVPERPYTTPPHSYPMRLKFLRGEKETHYVLNILFGGEGSGVLQLSAVCIVQKYVGPRSE
jgi:hypothetical protein